MWRMATACDLDPNSAYKYLLFCRDFAATSAIARIGGEPAGFVTGYLRPGTDTLFVWQIGVLDRFRQRGLGLAMLDDLRRREPPSPRFVEATITPDNVNSQRLFHTFAERVAARFVEETLFSSSLFPEPHASEVLVRIGPIGA